MINMIKRSIACLLYMYLYSIYTLVSLRDTALRKHLLWMLIDVLCCPILLTRWCVDVFCVHVFRTNVKTLCLVECCTVSLLSFWPKLVNHVQIGKKNLSHSALVTCLIDTCSGWSDRSVDVMSTTRWILFEWLMRKRASAFVGLDIHNFLVKTYFTE